MPLMLYSRELMLDAIPPIQLWIGAAQTINNHTLTYLQKIWCPKLCYTCVSCTQIKDNQHHAVRWLKPGKQWYTLADLEPLFETVVFSLDHHATFFFIIESCDQLSTACANALLKVLEEPPRGYHFILLAQQHAAILPTITSRTIIKKFDTDQPIHSLAQLLSNMPLPEALKEIEAQKVTEQSTKHLLDALLSEIALHYRQALLEQHPNASHYAQQITCIEQAYAQLPMPGSTKIFWRNLLLTLNIL